MGLLSSAGSGPGSSECVVESLPPLSVQSELKKPFSAASG